MISEPAPRSAWRHPAPIDEPLTYPGRRPSTSFVLAEEIVWPVRVPRSDAGSPGIGDARVVLDDRGSSERLTDFLERRGAAPVEARFPVIGYGSNPVPGQLLRKFGSDAIVPVLEASLRASDVVYNLISNRGYAFAELTFGEDDVECEVGITLLDEGQLREIIVTEQNYHLAYCPIPVTLETGEAITGGERGACYIFAGHRHVWVPRGYDGPVPIAELPARSRKRPALPQRQVLALAIDQFALRSRGISSPEDLVAAVRSQADDPERPGKLKFDLQSRIERDPRSLKPRAEYLTVLHGSDLPSHVWANALAATP